MEVKIFLDRYHQAFGDATGLPLVFWYTDEPVAEPFKCQRCYIGSLKAAREGTVMSMSANEILCGGGKLYAGFVDPNPNLSNFISAKERYKRTPQMVEDFISDFRGAKMAGSWINFARVDRIDSFEGKEGLLFFATPDILSGLITWCFYDTNAPDAVSVPFGSGCSSITAQVLRENRMDGKRTFLGMFDPSARPGVEENMLTYAIPMSRFREMYDTMTESCLLTPTRDWLAIKDRINGHHE